MAPKVIPKVVEQHMQTRSAAEAVILVDEHEVKKEHERQVQLSAQQADEADKDASGKKKSRKKSGAAGGNGGGATKKQKTDEADNSISDL
jgi:hypothetical protein